jgi:precorrin-2 C(20)-methyltransferase
MKKGIFYAVGVGCSDPMDMTLKAKNILENSDVIIYPVKEKGEKSLAYTIACQGADIENKETIEIVFPMKHINDYRDYLSDDVMKDIYTALDSGKCVSMVTIGDVSVYSTASYMKQVVEIKGYTTDVVAGIPSFCSSAAAAKISICESKDKLVILPTINDKQELENAIKDYDSVIVMKSGKKLELISEVIKEKNLENNTIMMSNIGMEDEYIGKINMAIKSYFTIVMIKKKGLE